MAQMRGRSALGHHHPPSSAPNANARSSCWLVIAAAGASAPAIRDGCPLRCLGPVTTPPAPPPGRPRRRPPVAAPGRGDLTPRPHRSGREPLDSSGLPPRLFHKRLLSVARLAKRSTEVRGLRSRAITAPSSLLRPSPSQCAASGTLAFGFRPRRTPVPTVSSGATTRLVPEFHTRARTTFLPPLRRTPPGQERDDPARLIPGKSLSPGFDVVIYFSTRHRKVRFRSTPWCIPDRGSPAFSCNAQDPGS